MPLLTCIESFSTDIDGVPVTIPAGQLRDSGDPVVLRAPQYFSDPEPVVEQATSAPGEKRTTAPRVTRKKVSKDG